MGQLTPPVTIAEFKDRFDRDFDYGAGTDQVRDKDITRSLTEASSCFNPCLWTTTPEGRLAYLQATAHFLVLSIQAAGGLSGTNQGQGVNSRGGGVIQSKSVGAVSVAYVMPDFVAQSPILSQFMRTDYGQKYLQMLTPFLVGHVSIAEGPHEPDVAVPEVPFI